MHVNSPWRKFGEFDGSPEAISGYMVPNARLSAKKSCWIIDRS
jgi:hypothetical protein